jgi:hypothetical protein
MDIASTEETRAFLSTLWIRWGEGILRVIANHYALSDEQRDALITVLSRPNDWNISIDAPLS